MAKPEIRLTGFEGEWMRASLLAYISAAKVLLFFNIWKVKLLVDEDYLEYYKSYSPFFLFHHIESYNNQSPATDEKEGDLNHDGLVNAADAVKLVNIIIGE